MPSEYVLGYKKINGFWMELIAYKFPHQNVLVHPEFNMIRPMASKAVYKVIKHTNTYVDGDDGTANGFGDKDLMMINPTGVLLIIIEKCMVIDYVAQQLYQIMMH